MLVDILIQKPMTTVTIAKDAPKVNGVLFLVQQKNQRVIFVLLANTELTVKEPTMLIPAPNVKTVNTWIWSVNLEVRVAKVAPWVFFKKKKDENNKRKGL